MSSCFPQRGVITQRRGGTRNSNGEYIEAAPVETNVRMSFQPLNGVERNNLAEGQRKSEIFKVYFPKPKNLSPLQIGANQGTADTLTFDNIVYIFTDVDPWLFCLKYVKAVVVRRNNQDDA